MKLFFCCVLLFFERSKCTADDEGIGVYATRMYRTFEGTHPPRRTTFSPTVVSKTCLLNPEEGPCRGGIAMYYYDPATGNCSTFLWGGCQGNGNRFDSASECRKTCLTQPESKKSRQSRYCLLSFDYGWCFGAEVRYYYDRMWKVCKKTIYSGCGGNKNNFYNMEQCDQACKFGNLVGALARTHIKDTLVKKVIIINPPSLDNPEQHHKGKKGRKTTKGNAVVTVQGSSIGVTKTLPKSTPPTITTKTTIKEDVTDGKEDKT